MHLLGGCGLCEKCVILASMAGVVQNAVVQNVFPNEQDIVLPQASKLWTAGETTLMDWSEPDLPREANDNVNYDLELKKQNMQKKEGDEDKANEPSSVESWCVIWYLGAFGCLVCFFLVITCTELFFGNPLYRTDNLNSFVHNIISNEHKTYVPETPPPPYHLFAPPDYDETIQRIVNEKRKSIDIFVVPVHGQCSTKCPQPPAYESAVGQTVVHDKFTVVAVPETSSAVA